VPREFITKEMAISAVSQYGYTLQYVPDELMDKKIVLTAVKKYGPAIEYAPEALIDHEIALLAVTHKGMALKYVPDRLKNKEVIITAVLQDKKALQFVPDVLKRTYAYDIDSILGKYAQPQKTEELHDRIANYDQRTPEEIDDEPLLYPYDKFMTPSEQISLEGGDTVTIYIHMHGTMSMTPIPARPTNTVLGTSVGLCSFSVIGDELSRLNKIKEIYTTHPISEANRLYNDIYKIRVDISGALQNPVLQTADPTKSWPVLQHQYITQSLKTNFIRSYKTERYYSVSGKSSLVYGLYVIHTTNESLLDAIKRLPLTRTVLPTGDFHPITQEDFDALQSQNINNVSVANAILDGGMLAPDGSPVESNSKYTIQHYENLTLSSILDFFGRLGIKHVNIIEASCRVFLGDIPPPYIQRQHSHYEEERGAHAQARLEELGHGGTRKTRRKRSRIRTR
jgi:hypothetical protein